MLTVVTPYKKKCLCSDSIKALLPKYYPYTCNKRAENIMFMVVYFRGCGCAFHPGTFLFKLL